MEVMSKTGPLGSPSWAVEQTAAFLRHPQKATRNRDSPRNPRTFARTARADGTRYRIYYVEEDEGAFQVDIMRLGSMKGTSASELASTTSEVFFFYP